jgi:hypothetical protein
MATATRTTGRARQASGKSVIRTGAASQILRGPKRLASLRRPIQLNVTMLQAVLIDNSRLSPAKINRQPRRLEIRVTHTKQTPATQFNRQHSATSRITIRSVSNRHTSHRAPTTTDRASRVTDYASRIAATLLDTNGRFRRNSNSPNSFKTNDRVNSYSIQMASLSLRSAQPQRTQITNHTVSRVTNHCSPLTNHASSPLVIYSSHTPNPRSSYK